MNAMNSKIRWHICNVINLFIAIGGIIAYCLRNPKKAYSFFFKIFSSINEFYQESHGHLLQFENTELYKQIQKQFVVAQSNYFNIDLRVMRISEVQVLASLVKYLQPKRIFEIGTYNGLSTYHCALNSPDEAVIYTFDLPRQKAQNDMGINRKHYSYDDLLVYDLSKQNSEQRVFKRTPSGKKVAELYGNSKTFDFSPYYGNIDFVFIDGCHAYDFVSADTENAFKMLNSGGIILWHDFDYIIHRDVFRFLRDLSSRYPIYFIPNTRYAIYGKCIS